MERKKITYYALPVFLAFILIAGCAGYAGVVSLPPSQAKITIQKIMAKTEDYNIYYSGYDVNNLAGVLFDPQNDGRTLLPSDRWIKAEGQATVAGLISWIRINDYPDYYPALHKIVGPDNEFYGYVYTGWRQIVAKVLEDKTLYVYDLPDPPHYLGPSSLWEEKGGP